MLFHTLLLPSSIALNNGLELSPAMGYSSWNDCASEVTEVRIKRVTKALISTGLAAKGYIHVNIDEGWLKGRYENNSLYEDRVKFPSGMKALGEWVHNQVVPGKGKIMKYGLYTCRGTCQCGTKQYQGPGGQGHEAEDTAWLADAGADYLKVDSCCGSQDHDTAFSDYGKWRDGLNATGRPVVLSLCGWNTWYAPKGDSLGNSWRIAGDGTNWGALSNCINLNVDLQQYASPGAWNDPDLLQGTGVGSNDKATNPNGCYRKEDIPQAKGWYMQTELQSRAQFSMWAIMSAPLLISADVSQVSTYVLESWGNEELIAVSQTFRKGGPYQGARLFAAGGDHGNLNFGAVAGGGWTGSGHNVWGKLLPKRDFALVFVSNEDVKTNVVCNADCFAPLGILKSEVFTVRDLWLKKDVGELRAPFNFTAMQLPIQGGVAAYRFKLKSIVKVHWSLDWSSAGGNCKKDSGNVTIAPGSESQLGTQVASCTGQALPLHATLYCQVKASALEGKATLQVQQTESAGEHSYGPVVTNGCSVITYQGKAYPESGQCCFAE